jgi:hypothetical protein
MSNNEEDIPDSGLYAQRDALDAAVKAIRVMIPVTCDRIEYEGAYLAKTRGSTSVALTESGIRTPMKGLGLEVSAAFDRLRAVMYVPAEGSWFMVHATVWANGKSQVRFGYDEEPPSDYVIGGISYLTDQHYFPIDEDKQPGWLKQKLSEGVSDLRKYGEKSYPAWLKDMIAEGETPNWL